MQQYPSQWNDLRFSWGGVVMSIMAPKGRKHLSADALFRLVRRGFEHLPEHRCGAVDVSLTEARMSVFAMFSLTSPSLLACERSEPKATWRPSTAPNTCLATPLCVPYSIPCLLSRCARCARASLGTSSGAKRWKRGRFLLGTPCCASMAQGLLPLRRCPVRRVYTRSTATGRAPMLTTCWVRRWSIRTCVQ